MKNRLILFIYIIINLCTISVVKAGDYHLLPQPQKFTPSHLNFQVNKVQLSTPVLQQEWETLISEQQSGWKGKENVKASQKGAETGKPRFFAIVQRSNVRLQHSQGKKT